MNKKALIIIILLVAAMSFAGYKLLSSQFSGVSGFKIVSSPAASIFLNDKLIGKTPLEDKYSSGEYVLKLIPEGEAATAASWQGKITLNAGVLTYVNRDLGISELTSAGEILTFEKISANETQMAIFSQPDAATILLDGQEKGVTPLFIKDISAGDHDVAVSSPGFMGRTVRVQTNAEYKLVINFQLALTGGGEATPSGVTPTPSATSTKATTAAKILIKESKEVTDLGGLRVREGPSKSTPEIAKVKPGDKFPLLEEKEGWYKISYTEGKEGWVSASSRYTEKVE